MPRTMPFDQSRFHGRRFRTHTDLGLTRRQTRVRFHREGPLLQSTAQATEKLVLRRQVATRSMQAGDLRRRFRARVPAGSRLRRPRFELAGLPMARRYLLLSLVFVVLGGGIVAYALGQLIET